MNKKISSEGEFALINKIKNIIRSNVIGDDCAAIKVGKDTLLATTDIQLEGHHFLRSYDPEIIGFKAVSVNVSDIVASGGKPEWLLVSLLLPDIETEFVEKLYAGINRACKLYKCQVIGGNISRSDKIGIDIFALGKTKKFISRRQAACGDFVYLTGSVGDSRAGYQILQEQKKQLSSFEKHLVSKHLEPKINLAVSSAVASFATSSIDISDGLIADLNHIADFSNVAIYLDKKNIPISPQLIKYCQEKNIDPIDFAIKGGEDYVVAFTSQKNLNFHKIGIVGQGKGIFMDKKKIKNNGFDHFKTA